MNSDSTTESVMRSAHDLTLLGFGPHAFPMLLELAAADWGRPIADLKLQVIHNLPASASMLEGIVPPHWPLPDFLPLDEWTPSSADGTLMLGVLREPAASSVWGVFQSAKGLSESALGVIVHPSAEVAPSAVLGPGTWVQPHAVIASMSRLGLCSYVNRHASVGHHNVWGAFCRINPGAHTAGSVVMGDRVTIGMGALVREGTRVGDGAVIGAGSTVLRDVEAGQTVMGTPAKPRLPKQTAP